LYPVVAKVFETFGPLKDARTGLPLFNSAAWAVAKISLHSFKRAIALTHLVSPCTTWWDMIKTAYHFIDAFVAQT
jgi:hypothetical protein